MVKQNSENELFGNLPPLPKFDDFDDTQADVEPHSEKKEKRSHFDDLSELSKKIEAELHKSDVYRKEELNMLKEAKKEDKEEESFQSLLKKAEVAKNLSKSKHANTETVKKAVHKEAQAHDTHAHIPTKRDAVKTVDDLDTLYKRQQNYFDSLGAKLDHETRERTEILKQKEQDHNIKNGELLKWEKALLEKEKRIASHAKEYDEIKSLQKKLEDEHINLVREKERVQELKVKVSKKEESLHELQRQLKEKETQLTNLAEELVSKGAVIEKHTEQDLDHFAEQHKKLESHFKESLEKGHVREPTAHKPKPHSPQIHHEQIMPTKSDYITNIRNRVLDCYDALGNNNVAFAKELYQKARAEFSEFNGLFGKNKQLHEDLLKLYKDIVSQMH